MTKKHQTLVVINGLKTYAFIFDKIFLSNISENNFISENILVSVLNSIIL